MKMAKNLVLYNCEDEEYIEMVCCSTKSSPQTREFEFQMSESIIFPADELFYKGKLLPLYHPRRLQMLETHLLHGGSTTITPGAATTFDSATKEPFEFEEHDHYTLPPFITCSSTAPCTNSNTPLGSCNISPSESCRASCELNPDDYFFEWSAELSRFVNNKSNKKYSWCKTLKHSLLGQKLRSSRNYLKSLFRKSACSNESCAKAKESDNLPKPEEILNKRVKISKNKPLELTVRSSHPTLATLMKSMDEDHLPRRSFSRAIKKRSSKNYMSYSSSNSSSDGSSSSSSFSSNSNGIHELEFLRRSRSVTEIHECSIEAAIAHCKKSHKINQEI